MLLHIPNVLDAATLAHCTALLKQADWTDGRVTAGTQAATVKNNRQLPETSPVAQQLRANCAPSVRMSFSYSSRPRLAPVAARSRLARSTAVRAQQQEVQVASSSSTSSIDSPPPGCSRYTVSLTKPLGLVLEQQTEGGPIVVAEITHDGAAAKTGLVSVGDQLIATSGVTVRGERSVRACVHTRSSYGASKGA